MDTICLKTGIHRIPPTISSGVEPRATANSQLITAAFGREKPPTPSSSSSTANGLFSFGYPSQSFWRERGGIKKQNGTALDEAVLAETGRSGEEETAGTSSRGGNENWVLKILHVGSLWKERGEEEAVEESNCGDGGGRKDGEEEKEEECEGCRVEYDDDGGGGKRGFEFDEDSFTRLLKRVSLDEAKLYAQLCYLGSLAYCIPKIRARKILTYRGLRFVTSSIEKRELAMNAEKIQVPTVNQEAENMASTEKIDEKEQRSNGKRVSAPAAYRIAASAASYLQAQTKNIISFTSSKLEPGNNQGLPQSTGSSSMMSSEVASFMATTDSVTAVVAAKEEVKQAVADDLSSTQSSPCEWFICDDDHDTRYFVIQGSESLPSWQANLLFEPVEFEGLDVLVHRGIYEAAKGIYKQMLPEVNNHLKSFGRCAMFRFTGHSLGGSLSVLINLMLLIRGVVPASSLLPVVTFGAPSIMCGGDHLLHKLGLPTSHIQAITMHRDIVPRAFSCNYPNHVAEILKAVNRNLRNHPCLKHQKLLYAPMGELVILQPDEKFSPQHHLLPYGSGLYYLTRPTFSDISHAQKYLRAAHTAFLNSPHPLEILSDRSAYGSGGTIQRDHDMNSYLKSLRNVIRQELNQIRKSRKENGYHDFWMSVLTPGGVSGSSTPVGSINVGQRQFNFAGALHAAGRESLKRFSRLVTSKHMHLLVIFLSSSPLLLLGAFSSKSLP